MMNANRAIIKVHIALLVILLIFGFFAGERLGELLRAPLSNGVFLGVFLVGVVPYIIFHLSYMDERKKRNDGQEK